MTPGERSDATPETFFESELGGGSDTYFEDEEAAPNEPEREPEPERYGVQSLLGEGGMGRVLAVVDARLGRRVALKELKERARSRPGNAERFLAEARLTAQLEHPGVVPIYDLELLDDGSARYTMREIQGRTLREALLDQPLERRLALVERLRDACQAVGFAHAQGVLHRDLKPDNLMLGDFGETLVIDWGLAVRIDAQSASQVAGTPFYMAPEQARGDALGPAADVYSLGMVLVELLAGINPRSDTPVPELLERLRQGAEALNVEQLCPDAPTDLRAIARRCLYALPERRYADAGRLAEELTRWLTGQQVRAREYPISELLRRWIWRHRAPVGVALVATVLGLVAGMASWQQIVRERDRAVEAEAQANRARQVAEVRALTAQSQLLDRSGRQAEALARVLTAWERAGPLGVRDEVRGPLRSLAPPWGGRRLFGAGFPSDRGPDSVAVDIGRGWLVTGNRCCGVRVRDLQTGRVMRDLPGLTGVTVVATQGGRVVAGTSDGRLVLWDGESASLLAHADAHPNANINQVRFDDDGMMLGTAATDGSVALWSTSDLNLVASQSLHQSLVQSLSFTEAGLESVGVDGWRRVTLRTGGVGAAERGDWPAVSPTSVDDAVVDLLGEPALGELEGFAWSESGGLVRLDGPVDLTGNRNDINGIWTRGDRVLSWGDDQVGLLWSHTGEILERYPGMYDDHIGGCLLPTGTLLIDDDGATWIYGPGGHRELPFVEEGHRVLRCGPEAFYDLQGDQLRHFTLDGALVATHTLPWEVIAAELSGDGQTLWVATLESGLWALDPTAPQEATLLAPHAPPRGPANLLRLDTTGSHLASAHRDGTVVVWNLSSGTAVAQLRHDVLLTDLVLWNQGRRLATTCGDDWVRLWDVPGNQVTEKLASLGQSTQSLALSPAVDRLYVGTETGTLEVWQLPIPDDERLAAKARVHLAWEGD